jgi:hypothetical protein
VTSTFPVVSGLQVILGVIFAQSLVLLEGVLGILQPIVFLLRRFRRWVVPNQ